MILSLWYLLFCRLSTASILTQTLFYISSRHLFSLLYLKKENTCILSSTPINKGYDWALTGQQRQTLDARGRFRVAVGDRVENRHHFGAPLCHDGAHLFHVIGCEWQRRARGDEKNDPTSCTVAILLQQLRGGNM